MGPASMRLAQTATPTPTTAPISSVRPARKPLRQLATAANAKTTKNNRS